LLPLVSAAYAEGEADRGMIERTLDLVSRELNERNDRLRQELAEHQRSRLELQRQSEEQQYLIHRLEEAHHQLLQSEKMASIGQLAAGVAHEINNPIGFVGSNLGTLQQYLGALLEITAAYERLDQSRAGGPALEVLQLKQQHEFDYLRDDAPALLRESAEGVQRIKRIVQDLKDFSRVGEDTWLWADLHAGLDSTLNIVQHELKYVAEVQRCYGKLPAVECLPSQLNQVFMNLLVNAAQAICKPLGKIRIHTGCSSPDQVYVDVVDDGCGIAAEHLTRIFDPFFTTKPVGQGTGLGLSLSWAIVRRHGGRIEVDSRPGEGSRFRVLLPVEQAQRPPQAPAVMARAQG
jgi:signal transduction histidine kinase